MLAHLITCHLSLDQVIFFPGHMFTLSCALNEKRCPFLLAVQYYFCLGGGVLLLLGPARKVPFHCEAPSLASVRTIYWRETCKVKFNSNLEMNSRIMKEPSPWFYICGGDCAITFALTTTWLPIS